MGLSIGAAEKHVEAKASIWSWAGTEKDSGVDVVIASAGDVPTLEALAALQLLRDRAPTVRTRFVNVVDLMSLSVPGHHEHAFSEECHKPACPKPKCELVCENPNCVPKVDCCP